MNLIDRVENRIQMKREESFPERAQIYELDALVKIYGIDEVIDALTEEESLEPYIAKWIIEKGEGKW